MKRLLVINFLILLTFIGVAGLQPAYADPLFGGDGQRALCEGDAAKSAVCQDNTDKNPLTGDGGVLIGIANIIALIAGAAAVIVLIVSSIRYITSGGDQQKVSSAKSTLINALIGIAVIVLGRTLIVYVLNRI